MKHISEFMSRDPNEAEQQIIERVGAIAQQWMAGEVTLTQAKKLCTDYERFQAIRFLPRSSPEKLAMQRLVEHLTIDVPMGGPSFRVTDYGTEPIAQGRINVAEGEPDVAPLWLSHAELHDMGYKQVTNYAGNRVWVSPMYEMNGEWKYPPFEMPPSEERRKVEAAMNGAYAEYRRKKKGVRRGES